MSATNRWWRDRDAECAAWVARLDEQSRRWWECVNDDEIVIALSAIPPFTYATYAPPVGRDNGGDAVKPTRIYCPRCGRYPNAVMRSGIEIVESHAAHRGIPCLGGGVAVRAVMEDAAKAEPLTVVGP